MSTSTWNDSPEPFGNARGLDRVAVDVKRTIAERFGATVLVGILPADIQHEQQQKEADSPEAREPFAVFTISYDGGTLSGNSSDGHSHTTGYRGHYWLDRIGPETVVFDLRSIPSDDAAIRYAVRGPMLDASLPAGTVSRLGEISDPMAQAVTSAYLAPYGGAAALGH
jgi:hypothetical protein